MRSYLTRHGFGPLPNENLPFLRVNNPEETNQPNQFQGTLRYAPWDPDVIVNAMVCDASEAKNENRRSHLVITCLDQTANKIIITTDFGKSVSYFTVKQLLELLEFEFDSVLLCNGSGIENFHEYEFENAEVIS